MTTWTKNELNKIGTAEELRIAGLRPDGTLRKAVIIWVVRVGDELYVRSAHGRGAGWFKGVLVRGQGKIWAGGLQKEVDFIEETGAALNDGIDAAYLAKYGRYPQYVAPMVTAEVRAATIKLSPKE